MFNIIFYGIHYFFDILLFCFCVFVIKINFFNYFFNSCLVDFQIVNFFFNCCLVDFQIVNLFFFNCCLVDFQIVNLFFLIVV